jgi:magnesium chelatase family protein
MSLAIIFARACVGVTAPLVTVETHISNGLPGMLIVGLPETAVKEARDRVRSAIINAHFDYPMRRITVNLAPADLPKEGGRFDLAIALGILAASGQVDATTLADYEFIGELALSGDLRPVRGSLPAALGSSRNDRKLVVPRDNADEAALVTAATVLPAGHLLDITAHLFKRRTLTRHAAPANHTRQPYPDLSEVQGQRQARRALEIAAAGRHNLLFYGTPGSGKTMLATRLPGILPKLGENEALEVAAIKSIATHQSLASQWRIRPFRAPHHTASAAALVGGGSSPRPGEISLAHHGVLFLDELPEFPRTVLEVLREPLEKGEIMISRARQQVSYPADFQLIAAMNPCPCGYLGDPQRNCRCTPDQVLRYRSRISGPLLDRIDMHVPLQGLRPGELTGTRAAEASCRVQQRVEAAHQRQQQRSGVSNARLSPDQLPGVCALTPPDREFLEATLQQLKLSARAYHRILKVARTIADLAASDTIERYHLAEAISLRGLDRPGGV